MAIRKDIDDMLNTLNDDTQPKSTPKKIPPISHSANELSADDIVTTLRAQSERKEKPRRKRIIITGDLPDYEALRAQEAERERLELERQAAQRDAEEKAKKERIAAEREAAEQEEKARQARIRAEQERLEAERKAAEKAERERIAAEKEAAEQEEKARQARIKAEQERLEAERKAAEKAERERIEAERKAAEKAEKARIAAEKKAEAERVKAERAAEKKRLKEQREAEKAKRAEERRAAEEAERARIAEEKRAAEEAQKARIEAEKAEQERIAAEKTANAMLNASDNFSIEEINDEPEYSDSSENKTEDKPKEVSGGFIEFFKHILNEDPDEIINQRNDSPEKDDSQPRKGSFKKNAYAFFGVIFAVFACIGLIAVAAKGINLIGNFNSGDSNRDSFEKFLYPAVIMDIESFEAPAELTSEQILTAAIWSMIMTDGVTEQYELTFDVVMIPAADVEAYAVKLFGSELPELVHATVGPAESRFYYNEETKSYNVPVAPVTYTYSPEVRGATRSGDDYILVVDYIDELPEWLPKTSSKSVEFVITSTDDGYHLKSMKILSTSTNAV